MISAQKVTYIFRAKLRSLSIFELGSFIIFTEQIADFLNYFEIVKCNKTDY